MLAHSSIENVGIVVTGMGAGMVFIAAGHPAPATIAYAAALYHLINHSLYKTLLFIGVGAVETQTGTRDMDRLGGLIKVMPLAALGFLAGALSIAGLPPFNGFVSEWLTLQTMLRAAELSSTSAKIVFALCGAALALTAALAVTCFVKVFAMSFLGMRRLDPLQSVNEAGPAALASMGILAALCLALGVLPTYVIGMLNPASMQVAGEGASEALVPPFFASAAGHDALPPAFAAEFHDLGAQVGQDVLPGRGLVVLHRGGESNPVVFAMSTSYMLVALVVLLALTYVVLRLWLTRGRQLTRSERWDGGVRRLLPEMTYSATGFSNPVRVIFDAIFRPTTAEDTSDGRRALPQRHPPGEGACASCRPPSVSAGKDYDACVRSDSRGHAPRTHQRLRHLCVSGLADRARLFAGVLTRLTRGRLDGLGNSWAPMDGCLFRCSRYALQARWWALSCPIGAARRRSPGSARSQRQRQP